MDEGFHDRRDNPHLATDNDYMRPLTAATVREANRRFGQTGMRGAIPRSNRDKASDRIKTVTKERRTTRKNSGQDFESIGEYLDYLNETDRKNA